MQALFVDLPNFYSHFLESGIEEPRLLRDYFLEWFDFDRLAYELTGEYSTVWVFHSNRRFGPRQNRIENLKEGQYLTDFINRINSQKGVTARNVNIPGEQREPASYECDNCGNKGLAQWESEKGIDASLTVHLFDTMESWEDAYLLSGDADFVPAVSSLRRRGKIVSGAGFTNASSALIRECYDYIDLTHFLREDIAAYQIFKQDGILNNWLFGHVESTSESPNLERPIELRIGWRFDSGYRLGPRNQQYKATGESQKVFLSADGPIDLTSRHQQIMNYKEKYPNNVENSRSSRGQYSLAIRPDIWEGVKRRIEDVQTALEKLENYAMGSGGIGYKIEYFYDDKSNYSVTQIN